MVFTAEALEFNDVSVGRPAPILVRPSGAVTDGQIQDAREMRRGEILVAPVTDVGWTPYFTVIGALVTDTGSSVSHGAVVAREYGLPCVVNTLVTTQVLKTGDRVRVDDDRGLITRLASG